MFVQINAAGWCVNGMFPPFNPATDQVSSVDLDRWLREDVWLAVSPDYTYVIDVGWYPAADRSGEFIARLVRDEQWDSAEDVLESKDLYEILAWVQLKIISVGLVTPKRTAQPEH